MAMKLSEPVVQVIWPTVNVRPFGVAMEPEMMKTMANSRCATYNEFISDALT